MDEDAGVPGGRDPGEAPVPRGRDAAGARRRDLARGRIGLVAWGAPLALILVASALLSNGGLPAASAALLLVAGTAWFGATCLANGLRCGRVHCLVDGTLLPALAVVGILDLLVLVSVPWNAYVVALWTIVAASFCLEWAIGPYAHRPGPGA